MVGGGGNATQGNSSKVSRLARVVLGTNRNSGSDQNRQNDQQHHPQKSGKSSSSASDSGHSKKSSLVRRDTRRYNRQSSSTSNNSSDMDKHMQKNSLSLTEKRPSITAEELTPIVLNQLQTTSKLKEENRKLRRGSRSSNSSTPASTSDRQVSTGSRQSVQNHGGVVIDSGSESCGEEARLRTAEAFMSGIQSAIKAEPQSQAELSAELVGEVDSVLSKLMQSINNSDDPSLMPLIVNLQASLKATVNHVDSNKVTEAASTQSSKKKEVALSEFSTGADEPFFPFDGADGTSSKIPWKIRAARKRAMKHHTTGMTKDEFAKIKQSLMQSSANFQKAAQSQSYALTRNKSESAIKYYSTHGAPVDDEEDIGAQTEPVTGETDTNELGYASDVCDYNVDVAKSQTLPSRGFLIQPADTSQMLSNSNAKSHPDFNVLGRTVVSSHVKPMSPSIESSLYDRRQRLIQKRAKIFKSASSNSVLNLTEHFTEHINNQYNNYQQNHNNYKSYDSLLQIGSASNGCSDDYNNDYQSRKISQESTTTADDEDSQNVRPIRRRGTSTGVRARIARRKKMKDANSMDSALGTLSDQEATSEAYDEDDSVEEKQDSEPMDDWQSTKVKSPQSFDMISKTTVMSAAEMTPETARRNWNSRFSNIKSSFNAASEEDLSKSRSPSLHSLEDRSKSASKERSPMIRPYGSQLSGSASPALLRQTKEDKDKENSIKAITTVSPNNGVPLQKPLEAIELSKSKQPTPNRDNFIVSTPRASKSMPKETSYDERSRAEVLGLVKAGRGEDGPNPVAKSDDMDYQEYMNIISKVRKTKDIARARAEHFRLASMYAKEQKRQEELEEEEERLKIERKKIEAEAKTRPQPLPIMPTELKKSSPSPIKALTQPISLDVGPSQQQLQSESIEPKQEQDSTFSMSNDTTTLSPSHEEQRLDDIEKEHKRQQEIKENLIKAEQEKLQKLREEQMKQEKEREEIRRLEFERLRQIQEEQRQLEEERRRQEEHIRLEQLRIEEERKRQEKLQAEKNAEYNRQRLEMEAKNVAMNEGQRVILDPRLNSMSPHEKVLQERLMQQEMLRQEHRKEESKIRQEKLKLIQQEEMLIGRQEDMLRQIEAERTNLFKQEQLIRKRQQERLQQVRQEKMLLEKQEEMIRIREEQLDQERQRQEKLRQEQMALREQEEAIRKRQEQISKELMSANSMMTQSDEMNLLDNQIFPSNLNQVPEPMETFNINGENDQQQVFMFEEGLNGEGEEEDWSGSGSGSETIDEEVDYECKVEVKQPQIFAPTSVRSIESTIGNAPWAQVTPYLTYSESQSVKAQEEVTAIFSQSVSFTRPGVVTSPESMRTSTNLLTTPDNSLSLQSQLSVEPRSLSSSCANSPPAPVPPLPLDESSDALSPVPGKPPKLETSNSKESKKSNGPKSPRIGGPGSAFKPYASSDNLFDPGNLPRRSNTESSIPNTTKNYPLQNGNTLDSRFFMKGKVPPMHGKVRELKKPVHPPFSTTDTEPEMKECNLSIMDTRKKGKKVPVYSTSETEEEYQAYLKCKPKWHGKGGHKDSWDPLQIQSPPQITQKPVGVLQKPKPQPAGLPVIERGSQIGATPIFVPHQPVEPMKPVVHSLPPLPPIKVNANVSEQHKEITQPEEIKTFEPVINKNQMLNVPNAVKSHSPLSISAERTPDSKQSLSPTLHSGLSDLPKEKSPLSFSSQPSLSDKKEDFSQESEDSKPPKRTTAQQRLQQKLMSEALQKVEFKKQLSSKTAARPNPTIAAMEIMTRKELKAGEMEQRIARGEIPAPPIPTQQQSFFENVASQSKLNKPFQQEIRRSESMMMEKPTISPKPTFQKRLSQENVGSIAPIIVLKKQPKRLDPDEIKVRQEQVVKAREYRVTSPIARVSSSPVPTPQNKIPSPPREPQIRQKMASPVPKVSSSPVQPVPQKMLSPPVQPLPQKMLSPPKEQQKMKVSPEPIKKPIMKKVEKSTEKVVSAQVQATAKRHQQARSKSIGSNLAQRLHIASSFGEDDDVSPNKTVLPWASEQPKHSNPGIRKHIAARDRGYQLRMSKSSDSITAAKLLAEANMNSSNLRINQDMSKSMERQMDIYTKTREDIRKILEVAKACSVQDRIKLFNDPTPFTEPPMTMTREERAEAIRREILDAKAQDEVGSGSSDIQMQSPVEAKVKPLRIPMKPKLVESVENTNRPEPGSKLRINHPANTKAPEVKSILRTSTHSMDRSPNSTRAPSADSSLPSSMSETKPKSILVKTKKIPKLVHSNSVNENHNNDTNGGGPKIYAQSATDISGGEDDDSERSRKKSIPLTINTKAQFLEVPHHESGLKKSKSFSNPGQYECAMSDQEKSDKQKTIMAFFDASLNPEEQQARRKTSPMPPTTIASSQVVTRRSTAVSIQQKRAQVSSISDEILGEEDLTNVDEAFESLLNSTFQEAQARGRTRSEHSRGGSKRRSQSSHPSSSSARNSEVGSVSSLSSAAPGLQQKSSRKSSSNSLTSSSSVNRKQSRNKYLPRQQTWASGTPPPPLPQTPSPTQSEYDTCPDPWEDY
eukprot:01773.XXX_148_9859_1 [CDS] Oithona nana genome sequencing.